MNIVRENGEGQTVTIRVTVGEGDYNPAVDKMLHDYKRKANIPGFRPGMVPMGVINKMYRKAVVAEESYKAASQACFDYLEKEKIDYVGDVLPSEQQQTLDLDNNTEHEYMFEVGIAPQVNIEFTAQDKVTRYKIKADDKMYEAYRSNFLRRFGRLVDAEKVEKEEALTVTLESGETRIEEAYVGLISMSDEQRKPFEGKKVGDKMQVDVNELYPSAQQRAAVLGVKEEELDGLDPKFELTIDRIRKFAEPEMNEEFFKEAFPQGDVTDAKGLESFIYEQISVDLGRETEMFFNFEVRKMLMDKAALSMPEAFLRRWLFVINEGKFTMEQIDQDFLAFLDMMRWNLIQKYFADKLEIKITPEQIDAEARETARMQFAQYGMGQVPDEMLDGFAGRILADKEQARKIQDKIYEMQVIAAVVPMIKIAEKEVDADQFNKVAEKAMK